MRNLTDIEGLKFFPFVGKKYKDETRRLLVIGQSHHGQEHERCERCMTSRVIKEHLGGKRLTFFTKLVQLIGGDGQNEAETLSKIAFYNYVQILLPTSRKQVTKQEWDSGKAPFNAVVQTLAPTHILVLGKVLYRHMPPFDGRSMEVRFGLNPYELLGEYSTEAGYALAIGMPHLSSHGYKNEPWLAPVAAFLAIRGWPATFAA